MAPIYVSHHFIPTIFYALSDCAVCAEGYGRSLTNTCHSCSGALAQMLIAACTAFFVLALVLLSLTAVFLIGGRDGIKATRQSMISRLSSLREASSIWHPVREKTSPERRYSGKGTVMDVTDETIDAAFVITSGINRFVDEDTSDNGVGSTWHCSLRDDPDIAYPLPLIGVRAGSLTRPLDTFLAMSP